MPRVGYYFLCCMDRGLYSPIWTPLPGLPLCELAHAFYNSRLRPHFSRMCFESKFLMENLCEPISHITKCQDTRRCQRRQYFELCPLRLETRTSTISCVRKQAASCWPMWYYNRSPLQLKFTLRGFASLRRACILSGARTRKPSQLALAAE